MGKICLSRINEMRVLNTETYSFTQLQETTISLNFVVWALSLKLRICAKELIGRN